MPVGSVPDLSQNHFSVDSSAVLPRTAAPGSATQPTSEMVASVSMIDLTNSPPPFGVPTGAGVAGSLVGARVGLGVALC